MKIKFTFIISCLFLIFHAPAKAQVNNALDFDGIDDQVVTGSASGLITNSYHLSLSCWVYPTNASPAFPDFDGFAGFRNEFDGDFYMLQVGANAIEVRFRNSIDSVFTITSNTLQLNTWQNFVFTYDSTTLRLYKDGQQVDSTTAYGNITNPNIDFLTGNVHYGISDFFLQGKLDDISLWNKTLADDEVKCMYYSGIDSLSPGLQLYYNCNQGIAGGNNTSITLLNDGASQMSGSLLNFSLTGNTSNFVDGVVSSVLFTDTICQGEVYVFAGQNVTTSGSYFNTVTSSLGCDSTVQLFLTVTPVDTTVNQVGVSLIASVTGAVYQWIDCGNGNAIIPGAFINTYNPPVNGSYAVIITKNGCTDTSSCHTVNNVGIAESFSGSNILIYPSPANDFLFVALPTLKQDVTLSVSDLTGRILFIQHYNFFLNNKIDLSSLSTGAYYLTCKSNDGIFIKKLIKN